MQVLGNSTLKVVLEDQPSFVTKLFLIFLSKSIVKQSYSSLLPTLLFVLINVFLVLILFLLLTYAVHQPQSSFAFGR